MRYTRNMDFKEFRVLIQPGMQWAMVLIICVGVIGVVAGLLISSDESSKENFYKVLQGNETNDTKLIATVSVIKDIKSGEFQNWNESRWEAIYVSLQGTDVYYKKAKNTRNVIKEIHDGAFNFSESNKLGDLIGGNDKSIGSLYYALVNWPATVAYLENPTKEIIKSDFIKSFLPFLAELAIILIILLPAISYIYYNYHANNGWWRYPWRKWWAYPIAFSVMIVYTTIVQIPLLVLVIFVEIIITKKHKGGYSEAEERAVSLMKSTEESIRQIKDNAKLNKVKLPKNLFAEYDRCLAEAKKHLKNFQHLKAVEFAAEAQECLPRIRQQVNDLLYQSKINEINAKVNTHRKRFKNIGKVIIQKEKEILDKEITDITNKLSGLGKEIAPLQQSLAEKNLRLSSIEKMLQLNKDQDLSEDFDKIRALPEVEAVEVDEKGDIVTVYTKKISISGHLFGNYAITLLLKVGDYSIRNLTNASLATNRDHLHGEGGGLCFGDMRSGIKEFIYQRQCYAAIYYILIGLTNKERQNETAINIEKWPRTA